MASQIVRQNSCAIPPLHLVSVSQSDRFHLGCFFEASKVIELKFSTELIDHCDRLAPLRVVPSSLGSILGFDTH
jgi:hypothetical protein